jgi:hypothetical protein
MRVFVSPSPGSSRIVWFPRYVYIYISDQEKQIKSFGLARGPRNFRIHGPGSAQHVSTMCPYIAVATNEKGACIHVRTCVARWRMNLPLDLKLHKCLLEYFCIEWNGIDEYWLESATELEGVEEGVEEMVAVCHSTGDETRREIERELLDLRICVWSRGAIVCKARRHDDVFLHHAFSRIAFTLQ